MPFNLTPVVLTAIGGILIIVSVSISPETRGVDLAGTDMVGVNGARGRVGTGSTPVPPPAEPVIQG